MADWPAGLARGWHPVAYPHELDDKPLAARLMDRPLVLFRGGEGIAILEDRCPHRNAPLSAGRIAGGLIECPYHGWKFDRLGRCRYVAGSREVAKHEVRSLAVREHAGLLWTTLADQPDAMPQLPPETADPGFDSFWWPLPPSRAAIGDAIENLVDPIHAYFLHPGLVRRSRETHAVEIDFTVEPAGASACYTEPKEGMTSLQRLTEGSRTVSWGRYRAPAQVQITFEDRQGVHASISVVFSPVSGEETRPFACFSTRRGRIPAWAKRMFIIAFHRRVLAQDLDMLKLQADQCERFGGRSYHQGPLDMFGPVIWAGLNGRPLEPARRYLRLTDQG
ncbi:MAG: Rieske 2Fe-2S domain-containing protein [Rhizobiales bacterium]|nr:Rieske 2Fe-2S domain-containing protein [Hyphomicrobiales bacterium]